MEMMDDQGEDDDVGKVVLSQSCSSWCQLSCCRVEGYSTVFGRKNLRRKEHKKSNADFRLSNCTVNTDFRKTENPQVKFPLLLCFFSALLVVRPALLCRYNTYLEELFIRFATMSATKSKAAPLSKKNDVKGKRKMDDVPTSQQPEQDDEARAAQLAQLEAFGNAFMSSFQLPEASSFTSTGEAENEGKKRLSSKKRKRLAQEQVAASPTVEEQIPAKRQDEMDLLFESTKPSSSADASGSSSQQSKKKAPKSRAVETVVFGGESRPDADELKEAKKGWKAFMSSKIDKIALEDQAATTNLTTAEEEEEKQLVANDRLLSELLSTTLFAPGTGTTSKGKSNLSSNDTIARIMELSATESQRKGQAIGRGWGENELKRQQLAKAPAAIRQGMRKAAGERRDKEREKAKELGTWHPSLKAGYANQATATEMGLKKDTRKRQRGLGMGIGKFSGGTLKLSSQEISKVNGKGKSGGSSSKGGKGGKRK